MTRLEEIGAALADLEKERAATNKRIDAEIAALRADIEILRAHKAGVVVDMRSKSATDAA